MAVLLVDLANRIVIHPMYGGRVAAIVAFRALFFERHGDGFDAGGSPGENQIAHWVRQTSVAPDIVKLIVHWIYNRYVTVYNNYRNLVDLTTPWTGLTP
jgi:hypothetical protein